VGDVNVLMVGNGNVLMVGNVDALMVGHGNKRDAGGGMLMACTYGHSVQIPSELVT
jgi:hypothetical protein